MQKKLVIFAMGIFFSAVSFTARSAETAQSGQSEAVVALAREQAERGEVKEAEASYRRALSLNPLNAGALGGLIALYRHQGLVTKAQVMFAQLTPAQRGALGPSLRQIEAALLQDQADARLAKGQQDQAIKYLEQAVKVGADDTWLHFKLASQYRLRGSIALGKALLEDFQARHPDDADALYALALYQADTGDASNALTTLNRIEERRRNRDMIMLQQRLTIGNLAQDTMSLMESGKKDEAVKMLSEAESIAAGNEELMLTVALAWAEIGEADRGRALLDRAKAMHTQPSVNWRLGQARFLAAIKSEQELQNELKYLATAPDLSPSEKAVLADLQESAAIRAADNHIAAGRTVQARQTLEPFMKQKPGQVRLLLTDARIHRSERQWQPALDIYARILEWDKQNLEARAGLIDMLVASGQRTTALQYMDEWAGRHMDVYVGVHLSGLYEKLGEYDRARQAIDSVLAAHPEATYVLYDGWKLARRGSRVDDEIFYLKKLVIAEPYIRPGAATSQAPSRQAVADEDIGIGEFGSSERIQRDWKEKKLASLIDRRSRWLSAAADVRYRGGTQGLSEFRSVEVPLEYKTPWHAGDEVFFRADLVRLAAGTVDPASDAFGSMLLCQPICTGAPLRQRAQGMSFTAGYQRGDLSADLGVTPPNFPVSNAIGGIRQRGDLGKFGYSIEASRRPVTASLLSYAGAKDPNTGGVWGGVVASGARLGLSLDRGETFGFWSSLGWHNLTGRNVLSNRRVQIMAGEQWRVINEENRRLVIGVVGMHWSFSENAGEYTFGHGGYYSPYKYRSWSLPVSYSARSPRFSYLLRASVSTSRTQMLDAPLYPTDNALQSAAGNPFYTGGPGSKGTGHSAMAAWEYQVAPRLFAGGLFAIDRSDYYAPNRALLYLRYSFDHSAAQPVFMPPEPVEPTSQF